MDAVKQLKTSLRMIFVGGGTLGSVMPLLALLESIRRDHPGASFGWVGTRDGPEWRLVPRDVSSFVLPQAKLDRFFSFRNFLFPFSFLRVFFLAWKIIHEAQPTLIIGAGGFTQVPLMWAVALRNIFLSSDRRSRIFIHQQDIKPALSNVLCARIADVITVNFDVSLKYFPKEKTRLIGNPVYNNRRGLDPEFEKNVRFREVKPLLVVTGGGTGARQLNDLIVRCHASLTKIFNILLFTGTQYIRWEGTATEGVRSIGFTRDLFSYFEQADLVVTRGGLANLTELSSLSKPTIIIPMPHSHQEENARFFESHKAAAYFPLQTYAVGEKEAAEFVQFIFQLWDNTGKLKELQKQIGTFYRPDAAERWHNLIFDEMRRS